MQSHSGQRKRSSITRIAGPSVVIAGWILWACTGKDELPLSPSDDGETPPVVDATDTSDATDASDGSDAETSTTCPTSMPFKTETISRLGGTINTEDGNEWNPSLTSDEKTIIFARKDGSNGGSTLYMATRASIGADFGQPRPIDEIDVSNAWDPGGQLSASGDELVFATGSPEQIFLAQRGEDGIYTNVRAIELDQTDVHEPFLTSWGELFFTSDCPPDPEYPGSIYCIFRAPKGSDGGYGPSDLAYTSPGSPRATGDVNPVISRDGFTMYFASTYKDGFPHIFVTKRTNRDDSFGTLAPVDGLQSSDSTEEYPGWISDDGCRLYFSSVRNGNEDIYMASKL